MIIRAFLTRLQVNTDYLRDTWKRIRTAISFFPADSCSGLRPSWLQWNWREMMTGQIKRVVLLLVLLLTFGCSSSHRNVKLFQIIDGSVTATTPAELDAIAWKYLEDHSVTVDARVMPPVVVVVPLDTAYFAKVAYYNTKTDNGWEVAIDSALNAVAHEVVHGPPWRVPPVWSAKDPRLIVAGSDGDWYTLTDLHRAGRDYLKQHSDSIFPFLSKIQINIRVRQETLLGLGSIRFKPPGSTAYVVAIGPDGRGMGRIDMELVPRWP